MSFIQSIGAVFRRRRLEREMAAEMRAHLEQRVREHVAAGMPPAAARLVAEREFGNLASIQEECREQRTSRWLEQLRQDLRIGLRVLLREKAFFVISVVVLALGICGVTVQFSVINSALVRGLPFPESERLMRVALRDPTWVAGRTRVFWVDDENAAWSRGHTTVEGLAGYFTLGSFILKVGDIPQRFNGSHVTDDFFPLLGVRPALGRWFTTDDNRPEAARVTIISDSLWRSEFGGDRDIIGRAVHLNGKPATVVGVMPPHFNFPNDQLWLPIFNEYPLRDGGPSTLNGTNFGVIARLRPGFTTEQATAEFTTLAQRAARDFPNTNRTLTEAVVEPLVNAYVTRDARQLMYLMFGAVAIVLLIACVNVMNMQFARATRRTKELAVRGALGASRRRLLAQMLTESLIVAVAGAALGVLLAAWAMEFYAGGGAGLPVWMRFEIDGTVLAIAIAATLGSLLVAGLVPALLASRTDALEVLKQGGRGHTHPLVNRLTGLLVTGQIALTSVLLVASLLLVKSVTSRYTLDFGYDLGSVLVGRMNFEAITQDQAVVRTTQARILEQLRSSPHFEAAAFSSRRNSLMTNGTLELQLEREPERSLPAAFEVVSDGYFATLGLRPIAGREFDHTDTPDRPPTALVNATFARKHFPDGSPVGRQLRPNPRSPWYTIVGVVPDTLMQGPMDALGDGAGIFFSSMNQAPFYITLVVRGRGGPPGLLVEPLRRELIRIHPNLALYAVETPQAAVGSVLRQVRTIMQLFAIFGLVAMVLSAVGLYGVASFAVSQRFQEFGIRAALGATPADLWRLVLGQGGRRLLVGTAVGLLLAFFATRSAAAVFGSFLHKVSPHDPATYAFAVFLLALATLLACLIPARRAMKVDPMTALRAE